jgi:hypothetical protein
MSIKPIQIPDDIERTSDTPDCVLPRETEIDSAGRIAAYYDDLDSPHVYLDERAFCTAHQISRIAFALLVDQKPA